MNYKEAIIIAGIVLIFLLVCECYKKPKSIDTPPLLSISQNEWPEHVLDAIKRGIYWGQCTVCGFPVTDEDVAHGYGEITNYYGRGYAWHFYVCYRHVANKDSVNHKNVYTNFK